MGMINKEVIIFQIEDMLSNINKENLLLNGGRIDDGAIFLELMTNILALLKEQPQIIRCKDCKHRPKVPNWKTYENGFDIEFPEGSKCPCQCLDDGYYSWYPEDNWFCANGKRR